MKNIWHKWSFNQKHNQMFFWRKHVNIWMPGMIQCQWIRNISSSSDHTVMSSGEWKWAMKEHIVSVKGKYWITAHTVSKNNMAKV